MKTNFVALFVLMMFLSQYNSLSELFKFFRAKKKIVLDEQTAQKVAENYQYLEKKIKEAGSIYGINTGFGALCNTVIPETDLTQLQYNLMRSHAAGIGELVPLPIVKWMLLVKILHLAKGYSGIQIETLQRLIDFYNHDIIPVVYEQGSLGASGDLAPLAHLSLPLIGEGEVIYQNQRYSGQQILELFGWKPISLKPKEGLALLNGTQLMNAYGLYILMQLEEWWEIILKTAALSCEAFEVLTTPYKAILHQIRPHTGQMLVAKWFENTLSPSKNLLQPKPQVQDPYSFRCIPQVLGASYDVIQFVKNTFEIETNSVSDNPTIFSEKDCILSGGNFHGQPLALGLDFMAIALSEIASISERRCFWLLSGTRGLNPFLAFHPGLESGLMIAQYTAAAIVSQNKQLCFPNSVDTIPTSNGQEDHVSMGANAAIKCLKVFENLQKVIAIEFLHALRAIQLKKIQNQMSPVLQKWLSELQIELPTSDFYIHEVIQHILNRFLVSQKN
jgi:histidine ammonia-lyase